MRYRQQMPTAERSDTPRAPVSLACPPDCHTLKTFKVFRKYDRAERFMLRRNDPDARLRMWDLGEMTGDRRDVYFVVSYHGVYSRARSRRPKMRRARVVWTRPIES